MHAVSSILELESGPTFGAQLYARRIEKGLTQATVAHRAGISASYLSELENDRRQPPLPAKTACLARALDLSDNATLSLARCAAAQRKPAMQGESGKSQLPLQVIELIADVVSIGPFLSRGQLNAVRAHLAELKEAPM
ncbi:helix-turn-helix domain-containing protein [Variovorax sp. RB3P1]|uniref:helix-turn-helix domain-containing protein n=1 Tax=Variovorax sp. RB3P1 TaxID=3443732 RepID=UPI003F4456F0